MQVTKGTWLSSSPAQEPGNEAKGKLASSPARAKNEKRLVHTVCACVQDVGTPGYFRILPCHVTSEFGLDIYTGIVNLSG